MYLTTLELVAESAFETNVLKIPASAQDLAANDVLYMVEELNDFKGGMAENYVDVQLTINGYKTYYWVTLARKARSIPAIPIAESNPPIVVGMRQTNKDRKEAMVMTVPV